VLGAGLVPLPTDGVIVYFLEEVLKDLHDRPIADDRS
jgi:hypothetical protein